ncbi:MAG: T9SS type A sorting domain-containing protein [Flavobacteriales bacterium]|nr:T9SS type A sorting domain-containing protein [Flavobacteriales bacterium]
MHATIELDARFAGEQLLLRDALGSVLMRRTFSGTSASLDLNTLANGLYILEVHLDGRVLHQRLVVQR